jgi:uncharacterized membrane protein
VTPTQAFKSVPAGGAGRHLLASAAPAAALLVFVVGGLVGLFRYVDSYWLYRGFQPPHQAAVPGGARFAFVPVLLACHGLAFVALQLGFQRGSVLATAGLATLFTNALPIAAGTTLFGEGLGSTPIERALAFG